MKQSLLVLVGLSLAASANAKIGDFNPHCVVATSDGSTPIKFLFDSSVQLKNSEKVEIFRTTNSVYAVEIIKNAPFAPNLSALAIEITSLSDGHQIAETEAVWSTRSKGFKDLNLSSDEAERGLKTQFHCN